MGRQWRARGLSDDTGDRVLYSARLHSRAIDDLKRSGPRAQQRDRAREAFLDTRHPVSVLGSFSVVPGEKR